MISFWRYGFYGTYRFNDKQVSPWNPCLMLILVLFPLWLIFIANENDTKKESHPLFKALFLPSLIDNSKYLYGEFTSVPLCYSRYSFSHIFLILLCTRTLKRSSCCIWREMTLHLRKYELHFWDALCLILGYKVLKESFD